MQGFFLIWILLGTSPAFAEAEKPAPVELRRLDPHGVKKTDLKSLSLSKNTECRVCHFETEGHIGLKPRVETTCSSCHGKAPHAGVAEHLGKDLEKLKLGLSGTVTCLSCHQPHRWGSKDHDLTRTFLGSRQELWDLSELFVERPHANAMLKRICTECHSWN